MGRDELRGENEKEKGIEIEWSAPDSTRMDIRRGPDWSGMEGICDATEKQTSMGKGWEEIQRNVVN